MNGEREESFAPSLDREPAAVQVTCLQLPLHDAWMLVPGAAVAEVAGQGSAQASEVDAPPWLAGYLEWRGFRLPLVDPAGFWGQQRAQLQNLPHVVCNSITGNDALPFFALALAGVPQRTTVDGTMLEPDPAEAPQGMARRVRMNGREMLIPDLAAIEGMLAELGCQMEKLGAD